MFSTRAAHLKGLLFFLICQEASCNSVKCNGNFTSIMTSLGNHERALVAAPSVKLVILVIHVAHSQHYRDAHRRGWINNPEVCSVNENTSALTWNMKNKCKVFYAFVVGNDNTTKTAQSVMAESVQYGDVITLSQSKDPARGHAGSNALLKPKVMNMFRRAFHLFPWATHLAKMDIDAHPKLNLCLRAIEHPEYEIVRQTRNRDISESWSENNGGIYYGTTMGGSRGMQQGQFYALSRTLVRCVTSAYYDHGKCMTQPGEDSTVACLVHEAPKLYPYCSEPVYLGSRNVYVSIRIHPHKKTHENTFGHWNSTNYTFIDKNVENDFPGFLKKWACA